MLVRALTFIPLAHIGLCCLYIYFFAFGFGGNVGQFTSAADIFTVGISKIAPFYVTFLGGLLIIYLGMEEDPTALKGKSKLVLHHTLEHKWLHCAIFLILVMMAATQLFLIIFAHIVNLTVLAILAFFPIIKLARIIIEKNQFSHIYGILLVFALVGLAQVCARGYTDGFSARHHSYATFRDYPSFCGEENKVLFVFSDWMFVISKNEERFGISQDCETRMNFENRTIVIDAI